MASSGTINGNQSGTQPYLRISWSILSQDIPNNRSRVRLQLILVSPYSLFFSASKTGSNNGSSFTYTGGFSGTGTRTLNTRDIWVNHNSDGTRTQSVNGSFNIQVSWGGSNLSSLSVSGSMNLDTIPRASEVTAFSMGSSLQISTSNSVNVRLNVYSTAFRFDVSLRYGSTTIASWNNQNFSHNTSRSLSFNATEVNNLLSAMRNVTSGTVTIRVQTKSGSGGSNIGSVQTRNATASVHSNVQPFSSLPSASISGSGRDNTINRYVQNVSRVAMSASTFTAGYGATITSRALIIRHSSGTQVERSEHNGTSATSPILRRSGTYNIYSQVTDSRGRSYTSGARQITVQGYAEPVISGFRADRVEATPTSVDIRREGNHSSLGGLNPADIIVSYRTINGNWQEISHASLPNHTSDSFGATPTSTGHSVTESYEFRLLVTDSFNNTAEATSSITTQRVVLDVHKNEGVGIGKIHEQGALDVDGDVYMRGGVYLTGLPTSGQDFQLVIDPEVGQSAIEIGSTTHDGLSFIDFHTRAGDNDYDARILAREGITGDHGRGILEFTAERLIYRDKVGANFNARDVIGAGSNSNGDWVRFYDGTQICWNNDVPISGNNPHDRYLESSWNFPISFSSSPNVSITKHRTWQDWAVLTSSVSADANNSRCLIRLYRQQIHSWGGLGIGVNAMAIGRWR